MIRFTDPLHPQLIEYGIALSTKGTSTNSACMLGLCCSHKADERGAKYGIGHVNNNGLRVSLMRTGARVIAQVELANLLFLTQLYPDEAANSTRLQYISTLGEQRYGDGSSDLCFPTEYCILFDINSRVNTHSGAKL